MSNTRRVVIVGGGPGGIAAARRLRERAAGQVGITLVQPGGAVDFLAGTIDTALGQTPAAHWRQPVRLRDVEVLDGTVTALSGSHVEVDGERLAADAVIAAPGLALGLDQVPRRPNLFAFWDPVTAERATEAVRTFQRGTIAVVISSLPYRCPPAPYGLALRLARQFRDRRVEVMLTTPETTPLQAVGPAVTAFLTDACREAGVRLLTGFEPDFARGGDGRIAATGGAEIDYDLALVVPPHVRHPILVGLPGQGPLVQVSPRFETAEPGLYVVGDAAQTALPRAADAAAAGGRTAADAVLARLGLAGEAEVHRPEPECFVGHGDGAYSRIAMRFPRGLPPEGQAEVSVEGPSGHLGDAFAAAFERWRALRHEA